MMMVVSPGSEQGHGPVDRHLLGQDASDQGLPLLPLLLDFHRLGSSLERLEIIHMVTDRTRRCRARRSASEGSVCGGTPGTRSDHGIGSTAVAVAAATATEPGRTA